MMRDDFCIFILTHGRADNVITYKSLKKTNVDFPIFFIVDDGDDQIDLYKKNFGEERVLIFNKAEIAKEFDLMGNFDNDKVIVYARNVCFKFAERLGFKYFLELDDDYTGFYYLTIVERKLKHSPIHKLQEVLLALLKFYQATPFKSIAMAQGGDLLGGVEGNFIRSRKRIRKCMNSFICSTERPFKFIGRINEDVNTYVGGTRVGNMFLTIPFVMLVQKQTQTNSGGMTAIYQKLGTYVKSFYTVMIAPSAVKVAMMGSAEMRLHHRLKIDSVFQEIIPESFK